MSSTPRQGFDFVPFLDAVIIALFVSLNISAFVFSPGTSIRLPASPYLLATQADPAAVLTVDKNQLYFFEGLKLAPDNLEKHLIEFMLEYSRLHGPADTTLLLKADSGIQTEELFRLMDIARRAGFTQVHLAAEPVRAVDGEVWDDGISPRQP